MNSVVEPLWMGPVIDIPTSQFDTNLQVSMSQS